LANALLKDEESARDNHVLAFNFAKYSLILLLMTYFADILQMMDGSECDMEI